MPEREILALRQRNAELESRLAQRESDDNLYRFLFDTMDEGFCVIEFFDGPHGPLSDYVHLVANAAYARHAGIANVVGQKLREMVPDEADNWVARYGAVLRTGKPLQFEQELVATGRVLSVTTFRIEPAERRQVAVLFKDVTERRRAEDALQQLNDQLEQRVAEALAERGLFAELVENSVARVQVVDTELRLLAVNHRAVKDFEFLFGHRLKAGDSLPERLANFPAERARSEAMWRRALAGESYIETIEYGRGARLRHFELRFNPLRESSGRITGACLFIYDVTRQVDEQQRRLQAEEALRQAQKMEAVGQLTGGIAHDFNNLLGGMLGAQELLRQRLEQGRLAEIPALLDTAGHSARRAAALVHRLLAFSRRQTLLPQATAVGQLVKDMVVLIHRSVGPAISVQVQCDAQLWPSFIDPPQLESALLNLCINARDALPAGGMIDIKCDNRWLDDSTALALDLPCGPYLCLSVQDNGRGMTQEVQEKAIDPFFTTKPLGQGTGLGLSMAYGFVRQSGGQLQITSSPGAGTRVDLYLPRHGETPIARRPPSEAPAQVQRAAARILLVEDQAALRMVIGDVLEELGHSVERAEHGPAALELLESGYVPQLLISDIGLPAGLDGRQVAERCRARFADLPVLFITGYDQSAAQGDGRLPPRTQVLLKPFELPDLVDRVITLLG
ncbi:PAS domain-containing protein [Pseudomonas sp. RIT623]|uniref:PAS domain-containing protein n=1 Tax=Pseudomonas sp. RIT623 TaxID=2559075 RepID=UPI00106F62AB|nr:PAS domain-containing protein [Pseudomonas sp. RIT623]TFF42514.1 response regulator [Pseudomonas sp. RIT623]